MEKTHILVVDDHALFREAVALRLSGCEDLEVIGQVGTIEAGLEVLNAKRVDLVLLDLDLGTQKGGEFLKLARLRAFKGKVLIVTAGVGKQERAQLLQNGGAGIFFKHENPELLIRKIRETMTASDSNGIKVNDLEVEEYTEAADDRVRCPLTYRERQVFRYVFSGLTNREIASETNISEAMVKAFIRQLFKKTGAHSRAQLVRIAIEQYWNEISER